MAQGKTVIVGQAWGPEFRSSEVTQKPGHGCGACSPGTVEE